MTTKQVLLRAWDGMPEGNSNELWKWGKLFLSNFSFLLYSNTEHFSMQCFQRLYTVFLQTKFFCNFLWNLEGVLNDKIPEIYLWGHEFPPLRNEIFMKLFSFSRELSRRMASQRHTRATCCPPCKGKRTAMGKFNPIDELI